MRKILILVIEDDKFLGDLLVEKLTQEGFGVLKVSDGKEGLQKIQEEKPSLIVLDIVLPHLDGFEVLRLAKENKDTASIPVLVVSNLGEKEDIERALKLGATDFMIKAHFTPGEVVDKIKTILG